MDIVLLSLALTAFVLALFWTVQRLMRILPAWANLDVVPSSLLLIIWRGVVGLGLLSLWIDSLYNMLAADKWTLPFCKNLIWVILIPTWCLYLLNRLLTKNPELPGTMGAETLNELPHAELSTRVRELADDGQKLEACKAYKEETGVSLTDAKKTVEAYIYGYQTPCKMNGSISFQNSTNQSLGDSKALTNHPMQPSGEIGRFEVDDRPSPPADR